jgi:hypothetical protein
MMPSTSIKQRNFMSAASHNPAFAAKVGIPISVAQDFHTADLKSGAFAGTPHLGGPGQEAPTVGRPKLPKAPKLKGAFVRP